MNRTQLIAAMAVALLLGILVSILSGGFRPASGRAGQSGLLAEASGAEALLQRTAEPGPEATPGTASEGSPTPVRLPAGVAVGQPHAEDLSDVLLLYSAANPTNFDSLFCNLATYYGLQCKQLDVQAATLDPAALQDEAGQPYRLVGLSASSLMQLSPGELELLQRLASEQGASVLVSEVDGNTNLSRLSVLAGQAISAVTDRNDAVRNWVIPSSAPEVTLEFTGQEVQLTEVMEQADWALELAGGARATPLIQSVDDFSQRYAIFASVPLGNGTVYINAGDKGARELRDAPLRDLYYGAQHFSTVVPLMMTFRHALGDEVWHQDTNYANLTLDGVPLLEEYENLNYAELLAQMERHDFHTTIAMPPAMYQRSEASVISLLLENPHRYSVVQSGNNRDGYEFYHYEVVDEAESEYPPRPLHEQDQDIKEGLQRMLEHQQMTSIPFDRVMIFPYGIAPAQTLPLLKRMNYLATVNAQDVPLGSTAPEDWDFSMQQSVLDFENFPVVPRRQFVNSFSNPDPIVRSAIFDLFIDRPALFWSTPTDGQLFTKGIDEFNVVADRMNAIPGDLEWRGLGDTLRRLHKQKVNDDESIDVKMCCNHLIFTNEYSTERTYHVIKEETENVPIRRVMVSGAEIPYRMVDGFIVIDLKVPAHSEVEILIEYGGE